MVARRITAAALVAVLLASSSVIRPPAARAAAALALSPDEAAGVVSMVGQATGIVGQNISLALGASAVGVAGGYDALSAGYAAVTAWAASHSTTVAAVLGAISADAVLVGGTIVFSAATGAFIYNILSEYADSIGISTGSTSVYDYSTSYYLLSAAGHRIKWFDNYTGNTSNIQELGAGYSYPLNVASGSLSSASIPSDDSVTIGYSVNGVNRYSTTVSFGALSGSIGGQYVSMKGMIQGSTGNVVSKHVNVDSYRPYYNVALSGFLSGTTTKVGMYLVYIDDVSSPSIQGSIFSNTVVPYNSSYTSGITWDGLYGYKYQFGYAPSELDVSGGFTIDLAPEDIAETLAVGVSSEGFAYSPPVSTVSDSIDWDPAVGDTGTVEEPDLELPEDYSSLPSGWSTPNFFAPWVSFVVPLIEIFGPFAALVAAILENMFPSSAGWYLLSTALILAMVFGVLKRLLGG